MNIKLRFFASVREKLALSEEQVTVPDHILTVANLREWLILRGEIWPEALAEERALRIAINQEVASIDTLLRDGDEVAFFPPVTGG
ncbi:MAG: molybdopterin converting factor subunit 1 [Burkholderiaceae bacterium]|nr:molybdopterin converting factor subunit 1 [Burkholderiaceae bacterium]